MTKINMSSYWLVALLCSHLVVITIAYPQTQLMPQYEQERRYAEKPNHVKKVALDDIDQDIQTNQVSESPFSWTNMLGMKFYLKPHFFLFPLKLKIWKYLGMVMQMMFNNNVAGPTKSDDIDNNTGLGTSPWANIISIGLRIVTSLLGGAPGDGIDKVDNGAAGPMQVSFIFIFFSFSLFYFYSNVVNYTILHLLYNNIMIIKKKKIENCKSQLTLTFDVAPA